MAEEEEGHRRYGGFIDEEDEDLNFLEILDDNVAGFYRDEFEMPVRSIVREVYMRGEDRDMGKLRFARELERALVCRHHMIVIEPYKLGHTVSQWILVGNALHRISVYGSIFSILSGWFWPHKPSLFVPSLLAAITSSGFFRFGWQSDPASIYQVCTNIDLLNLLPLDTLEENREPIVLEREPSDSRYWLHRILVYFAFFQAVYRLYNPPTPTVEIPASLIPKNPYPYHPLGTGRGWWFSKQKQEHVYHGPDIDVGFQFLGTSIAVGILAGILVAFGLTLR